jgi:hypothetical protein
MKNFLLTGSFLVGMFLMFVVSSPAQVAPQAEPVYGGHLEEIDAIPLSSTATRIFCSTMSPNSLFYQDVTGITGTSPTFSGWTAVPDLDEDDDYGFLSCFAVDDVSGFVFAGTMTGDFVACDISPGSRYTIGTFIVEAVEAYQGRLFFERNKGPEEWLYICDLDASGNIVAWDSTLIVSGVVWNTPYKLEIHISPFDNHVYFFVPGAPPIIYRSSDPYNTLSNSTTWTTLTTATLLATGKEYLSMGIAPDGRLFTGSYEGNSGGFTAQMAYTDTDGDPWTLVPITEDCGRGQISITNNTSGIYYVYFSRCMSDDMGSSWIQHGGADGAICVDPTGDQYAYVRTDWGSGCYNNNIGTVTEINTGLQAVQVNDFTMDITKNTAWVASKSGIWYVTGYGGTSPSWSNPIWPMDRTVPWGALACSETADTLFCGNNSGDAFRYESANGPYNDPMSYDEVFRASDDASYPYWNWTYGTYISALAIDRVTGPERIVIGLNDAEDWGEPDSLGAVFIGEYTGGAWVFDQIIGPPIPWTGLDVNDLVVVEENNNTTIYVGVDYNTTYGTVNGIYRMEETAPGTWSITSDLVNSGGTPISATIMDLWVTDNDTILACGTDVSGSTVVSYKKPIGGTYWIVVTPNGLPFPATGNAITYDETGLDTYIAVMNRLFVLQHGATSWIPYYDYPAGTNIQFIYYDDLLVGTGTGLYLHTAAVGMDEPLISQKTKSWIEVAPNPFSARTTFAWDAPDAGNITIILYDLTGREVGTFSRYTDKGSGSFSWSGTDQYGKTLPGGIYFYRCRLNQQTATGKLIIHR